jgi:hypothetical protein
VNLLDRLEAAEKEAIENPIEDGISNSEALNRTRLQQRRCALARDALPHLIAVARLAQWFRENVYPPDIFPPDPPHDGVRDIGAEKAGALNAVLAPLLSEEEKT